MDNMSQVKFERITAKPIGELTGTDKVFLRARRDYLNEDQAKQYKEVLTVKKAKKIVAKKVAKPEVKKPEVKVEEKKPVAKVNPEFEKLVKDAKEVGVKTEGLNASQIEKAIDAKLSEK